MINLLILLLAPTAVITSCRTRLTKVKEAAGLALFLDRSMAERFSTLSFICITLSTRNSNFCSVSKVPRSYIRFMLATNAITLGVTIAMPSFAPYINIVAWSLLIMP